VAVTAIATVVHTTFPSRVQYKSLEPDGLATARIASTGDASGGNVLHTFRGQAGFLYILRNCSTESAEVGAVNASPDVTARFDAQWLADATGLAQGDFVSIISMAQGESDGATISRFSSPLFINDMIQTFQTLFLGKIQRTGVFDILALNHRKNVLSNTYVSIVVFDVYRTESLTIPGILDRLRYGLVR